MNEQKLTDWFPPEVRPVREGVYEIKGDTGRHWFAYWLPDHGWGYSYSAQENIQITIELAVLAKGSRGSVAKSRRWRGLAVQP